MFVYLPRIFFWKGLDIYLSFFKCLKPNILFLVIDSFRADKFFGSNKSSLTPNIDKMIQNGVYFKQAISSADGTPLSLASIFTGLHPFKTEINTERLQKINPNLETYYDILKNLNYNFYGLLPTLQTKLGIFPEFQNENSTFDYYLRLSQGLGSRSIELLESCKNSQPWFLYLLIDDIHFPIVVEPDFNDEKYGKTNYDKTISNIDFWLGKILEKIDVTNTLVVLTADHGSYLSSVTHDGKQISLEVNGELQTTARTLGNLFPKKLRPVKNKIFFSMEKVRKERRVSKLKNLDLKPHEKRGLLWQRSDVDHYLFDDTIHVPLLFYGYGINQKHIISQQVRTIDIFPTIVELIGLPSRDDEIDGRSLLSLIEGKNMEELSQYIESSHLSLDLETNDVIGIRSSEFKYFRDRNDQNNNVHLYNLKSDPHEDHNISYNNPEIVTKLENILQNILKSSPQTKQQVNEDNAENIEEELRKLGYV